MCEYLDKCTLVVASTDINEDIWPLYFETLCSNWECCRLPIMLVTQTKTFKYMDLNISRPSCNLNNKTWSERLIVALNDIQTEYVLLMCDDYFFTDSVNTEQLNELISWMEEDKSINVLYFETFPRMGATSDKYPYFVQRPECCKYRMNCQTALWRKQILLSILRPHENPWELEILGSKRIKHHEGKFYALTEKKYSPIQYSRVGVLVQGRWVEKEIKPLAEKYGWVIDYNKRNYYSKNDNLSLMGRIFSFISKCLKSIKIRITYIRDYRKSMR